MNRNKTKVILVNPPNPFLIDQKSFSPLGLLYLAAALKKNGIEVEVVDMAYKKEEVK